MLLSALAMAALTAAFVDPPEGQGEEPTPTHPQHWAYGGEGGPERWAELSPDNKPCSIGHQQSPIDLASAMSASIDAPHPHWIPAQGAMVVNNITLNGHFNLHYDEALGRIQSGQNITITSWKEL